MTNLPKGKKYNLPVLSKDEIIRIIFDISPDIDIVETHGKGKHTVFFLPQATRELHHITSYGRWSPMNHEEQKLQGIGLSFQDEEGTIYHIPAHMLEIPTKNRSGSHAATLERDGSWNWGLDYLDYYRSKYIQYERQYNTDEHGNTVNPFLKYGRSRYMINMHTHPGIGTFFSVPDRINGKARAGNDPIVTMVVDPVRKEVLAGIGENLEEASVVFFDYVPAKNSGTEEEEIVRLSETCLRKRGYQGKTICRKRFGRTHIRVNMTIPKEV